MGEENKELARALDTSILARELPSDQRALAALIINMLGRHSHEERVAVLRFALEKEKYIPVNRSSVFSGTVIDQIDGLDH
jgi:hypothetical protein